MKFKLTFLLLFFACIQSFGQQFGLKELVAMTRSQSAFEQNMAKKANFPKSKWEDEFVQYRKMNDKTYYWEMLKYFKDDSLVVNITRISGLGLVYIENYNVNEEYGTTIYQWNSAKVFSERGVLLTAHHYRNERTLSVNYQRRDEYLKVLDQINVNAKFIETRESTGFFDEKQLLLIYKYLDVDIAVKSPRYSELGGEIILTIPVK